MYKIIIYIIILSFWLTSPVMAMEIHSRYTTVVFGDQKVLKVFNKHLYMGRLKRYLRKRNVETIEDEVSAKLDIIMERVKTTLEMFPQNLKIRVVLYPNNDYVKRKYRSIYRSRRNPVAFFDPKQNTVYISVGDVNINIVAHEFGHVVVENYYGKKTPVKIHEVLATFAENHIKD